MTGLGDYVHVVHIDFTFVFTVTMLMKHQNRTACKKEVFTLFHNLKSRTYASQTHKLWLQVESHTSRFLLFAFVLL